MKKISAAILFTFLLFSTGSLYGKNDMSDLRGLTLTNAKIPIYNRGGKMQMMIFVHRAERHGRVISGRETVLDFIRPSASVDDIGDAWKLVPYPLNAPFKQIFEFWLPRIKYSEAVVRTSKADIDPESNKASGSAPVFLRSPLLDLNGVGFEADFKRREIRINSDIEVVLRTSGSDPRKAASIRNKKHEYINATGDALLIELEAKRIMLIGNVTVSENQAKLTCDRLTVMLAQDEKKKNAGKADKNKKAAFDTGSDISGVSKILADGNIVISGTQKNTGKLYADHLVYDMQGGTLLLTCDDPERGMSRAGLKNMAAKLNAKAPQDIPGYVTLDDSKIRAYGKTVLIKMRKSADGEKRGTFLNAALNREEAKKQSGALEKIIYPSGLVACSKPSPGQKDKSQFLLDADYGEYLPEKNAVNLKNNVTASDGGTILCCDTAIVKLQGGKSASAAANVDTVMCRDNVRLLHSGSKKQKGTLNSDKADFKIAENRIVFYENVKAVSDKSNMTCEQLELFLADKGKEDKKQKTQRLSEKNSSLMNSAASGKLLERAVATGNVKMTDPNAVLTGGVVTMYFRPLAPGEKPEEGMLHTGGVRLTRVVCDDGIKIVSAEKGDTSGIFGSTGSKGMRTLQAMHSETDLLTDKSTFTGSVSIFDELSKLECDTMHLYGVRKAAPVKKAASDDPDADPFAILDTESFAPTRVAIAGNVELDKVECLDNVKISRQAGNRKLFAGGERADYKVSTRKIIITGNESKRAWMQMGSRRQETDKLVYHLHEERFESSGNTVTATLKGK